MSPLQSSWPLLFLALALLMLAGMARLSLRSDRRSLPAHGQWAYSAIHAETLTDRDRAIIGSLISSLGIIKRGNHIADGYF